jgi:hypothetical protein
MGNDKKAKGQTLVETAIILSLLLLVVLGIAEFSRAWFMKSSLKNAVRQGVRTAVVTPGIIGVGPLPCPQGNVVLNAVCTSPGVPAGTSVSLVDVNGAPATAGDEITVTATANFTTIVPKFLGSFIPTTLSASASMRYE